MEEQEPMETNPNSEQEAKIICAWCNKSLGTKKGISGITHSICGDCLKKQEDELKRLKREKNEK